MDSSLQVGGESSYEVIWAVVVVYKNSSNRFDDRRRYLGWRYESWTIVMYGTNTVTDAEGVRAVPVPCLDL